MSLRHSNSSVPGCYAAWHTRANADHATRYMRFHKEEWQSGLTWQEGEEDDVILGTDACQGGGGCTLTPVCSFDMTCNDKLVLAVLRRSGQTRSPSPARLASPVQCLRLGRCSIEAGNNLQALSGRSLIRA